MALALVNSAIIIITVYSQLILINCNMQIPPTVTEPPGSFRLEKFVTVTILRLAHCSNLLDDEAWMKYHTGLHTSGHVANEDDFRSPDCFPGEFVLDWDADNLDSTKRRNTCAELSPILVNGVCDHCICARIDQSHKFQKHLDTFSLLPQESDSENNKVVTGLRFHLDNNFIHLQIQHATLLENGKLDYDRSSRDVTRLEMPNWEDIDASNFTEGTHYSQFSLYKRTLFLDDVFVPEGFVVTGVKFVATRDGEGLKMQVKGTQYDSNYRLLLYTDEWFDYEDNYGRAASYSHIRTKLDLPRCKSDVSGLFETSSTNHYVQFKEMSISDDDKVMGIHPRFSNAVSENPDYLPLRGLGLSLNRAADCSSDLFTRSFVHESFVEPRDNYDY